MLFIYVEKGKIPIKPIEYIKKYRLKIVIKELDIITKEILEMYESFNPYSNGSSFFIIILL